MEILGNIFFVDVCIWVVHKYENYLVLVQNKSINKLFLYIQRRLLLL